MGLELRVNGETVKKFENPVRRVTVSTRLGAKTTFPVSPDEGIIDLSVDTRGSGDILTASDEAAFNAQVESRRREQGVAGISHVANPGTTIQDAAPITAIKSQVAREQVGQEMANTKEDKLNSPDSGQNQNEEIPGSQFSGSAGGDTSETPDENPENPGPSADGNADEVPTEENTDPNNDESDLNL